ncbi:family 43 glycosylhydrolase [candidate division KSB1 bacterium]|nr:family 43 glycosylhydrolase [candidate division KSB1 bacterium]
MGDSPVGPFTDPLGKPLVGKDNKADDYDGWFYNIDPAVFNENDGRSYLFWGNGVCFMAELNDDMISFKSGKIHHVQIHGHKGYREGPFVWKRNAVYYLLYSRMGSDGYDVLDYATSAQVNGAYRFKGTIIGHGKIGNEHGSVFEYNGQWDVAYHDLFPTDKFRKTCLEIFHYRDNGDIVTVLPTREGVGW